MDRVDLSSPPDLFDDLRAQLGDRVEAATDRAQAGLIELAQAARDGLDRFLARELRQATRLHVYPGDAGSSDGGDWILFEERSGGTVDRSPPRDQGQSHHDSKTAAVRLGRDLARRAGAVLVIHRTDGSVQSTYHYEVGDPA